MDNLGRTETIWHMLSDAMSVYLRPFSSGHPVELGDAWRLERRDREADCQLWSHQFGFERRLMVGELMRSQVCRSSDEVLDTQECWKAAMIAKGWS
jgi:hypothetical protein